MDSNDMVLSRFFSKKTIHDLIEGNKNAAYSTAIRKYLNNQRQANAIAIRDIYQVMRKHYRNEYFYKNTLLNKLLLGKHSLNTTTALSELRVSKSKADFVLINGTAVVYEIKTELDTLERLEGQINDYYKAFCNVYVITSESNYERVENLLKYRSAVGICVLTERDTVSVRRPHTEDSSELEHQAMFKLLRKSEFESLLSKHCMYLPNCKPAHYFKECYKLFEAIEMCDLYPEFIRQLKHRVEIDAEAYMRYVPYELRFLVYFSNFKPNDYLRLDHCLKSELGG